jgi:hypothetical protein
MNAHSIISLFLVITSRRVSVAAHLLSMVVSYFRLKASHFFPPETEQHFISPLLLN